jgi:osmotically-inducible protein OsmY
VNDEEIRLSIEEILATYPGVAAAVQVRNGTVHLAGIAQSERQRSDIERSVRLLPEVTGVRNELSIEFNPPEEAAVNSQPEFSDEFRDLGSDIVVDGTEYDFTDRAGTNDVMESTSEAEPYFPPTDPVLRPAPETEEGFEVVGGFAASSMEGGVAGERPTASAPSGDEELADWVRQALLEDATTTDLQVRVTVRNGVVYLRGVVSAPEDTDAAEEVASRVPGVVEVREELTVRES